MTTISIDNKGIQFDSPYTHVEVAQTFRQMVEAGNIEGNFANSLYKGAKRKGSYSTNQIAWVHVLVAQAEGRPTKPSTTPAGYIIDCKYHRIHEHLQECRTNRSNGGKGLLNPIIRLEVDGQTVVLKLAGSRSKNSGKVSVASDHRYGEGDFYGWIDTDGSFNARQGTPKQVIEILNSLADDPIAAIAAIGKESGRCCYCYAELTTVQSKIAGCGKKCADNYRIPYPTAAQTRQALETNPGLLDGASDSSRWI